MPSTYTLNNGITLIATGEQSGTWGSTTNTNLELVDTALDGQITITLASAGTSGSPNDLPISDGSASNGRNRLIIFNDGADLGATAYVQLTPNDAEKIIYVRNALSGSRSILLFQGTYNASNDYEVPAGTTAIVYFNGAGTGAVAANVFNNAYFDGLRLGSVSVTAILDEDNMASDSATALATQQSIKAYVDSQVGTVDTLAEILANGNTTGGTNLVVTAGDALTADTISETTAANGVVIDGVTLKDGGATVTADVNFGDNDKAIFGAGSDLQIYSDGTTGQITGNVNVTGTITSDGLTVDGDASISSSNARLRLFETDTTDLNTQFQNSGGDFFLKTLADDAASSTTRLSIDHATGDISFYEDTGTTAKFFWDASTERLGIGNSSPATALDVTGTITSDALTVDNISVDGNTVSSTTGSLALEAAGTFTLDTNSVERLRIASNGDISFYDSAGVSQSLFWDASAESLGINNTSPDGDLTIGNTSTSGDVSIRIKGDATSRGFLMFGDPGGVQLGDIMYDHSANSMRFRVNNSTAVTINSSGNVGIGTSSPEHALHVNSGTTNTAAIFESTDANAYIEFLDSDSGASGCFIGAAGDDFVVLPNASEKFRVTSSGNVGIGTTSPTQALSVDGRIETINGSDIDMDGSASGQLMLDGAGYAFGIALNTQGANLYTNSAVRDLIFGVDETEVMRVTDGNVGIGVSSPSQKLHVATGGTSTAIKYLQIDGGGSSGSVIGQMGIGFRPIAAGSNIHASIEALEDGNGTYDTNLLFKTNGAGTDSAPVERMRIDSSGNVGIGTSSPTATLDVNGTIKLDGNYPTGTNNVALGDSALSGASLSGGNNVAIGKNAGLSLTTGEDSVAIGSFALEDATTAIRNTVVGYGAGRNITTGNYNVGLGYAALNVTTDGQNNVAIGRSALQNNVTGDLNVAVGSLSLENNTTSNNTAVGYNTLNANTSGTGGVAVGYNALKLNTTGNYNVAVGMDALESNTTSASNVAVGYNALNANTAANNTAVGFYALRLNTTGNPHVAIGREAAENNTTGTNLVAVGYQALTSNTTGGGNNAVGRQALFSNTTGDNNTAMGYQAGYNNSTGASNTFIGLQAGYSNTTTNNNTGIGYGALIFATGYENTAVGTNAARGNASGTISGYANVSVGHNSMYYYTTGYANVAVGQSALQNLTTGFNNTGIGKNTLDALTTGTGNVSVGSNAGTTLTTASSTTFIGEGAGSSTTGSSNTFVGRDAGYLVTTGGDNTILGRYSGNQGGLDIRTSSNNIVLSDGDGNPRVRVDSTGNINVPETYNRTTGFSANMYVNTVGGYFRATSSARYKNTVNNATHGLTELMTLRPVTYKGNNDGDTVFGGLIAEEVHDAGLTEFVQYDDQNRPDALAYGNMVSLCIKAIQEQQATIEALEARITALENA